MELRNERERERDLEFEQSPKNPLYLQLNPVVKEVARYFMAQPTEGLTIYDFGCGSKPYQSFASKNEYVGIDIDEANLNADIHAPADNVPAENETADIACSFFLLEHVYEPNSVLKEKFRLLKPRGELFMIVPLYWEEHEMPYDYWRFTQYSLRRMLSDIGFTEIQTKPLNTNFAIMGLHVVRELSTRRSTRLLTTAFNKLFYKLDQRSISRYAEQHRQHTNVMTYAVRAVKNS